MTAPTPGRPTKRPVVRAALAILYGLPVLFILAVCGYLAYHRAARLPPPVRRISAAPFATVGIDGLAAKFFTVGDAWRAAGNDLFIEFRDPQGRLVDVGQVTFSMVLKMPGSVMDSMGKVLPTATPGQYRTTIEPGMAGEWTATLGYSGPRGQAETSFSVNVK
jgi:hypothetical protein